MDISTLETYISKVPDYPKKGILFYDISTLLSDKLAFKSSIEKMSECLKNYDIDKVAAIDARGFIFGSAIAKVLNLGLIMIRKKNKLPGEVISYNYELEYGSDCLEIKSNFQGCNVALVDDLLATGGTAKAACELIKKAGGSVKCFCTLIELEFLSGRNLISVPLETLIKY